MGPKKKTIVGLLVFNPLDVQHFAYRGSTHQCMCAASHIIDMVRLHSRHIEPRKEREKANVCLPSIPLTTNRGSDSCLRHMSDTALTTPLSSQQVQQKLLAPLFFSTLRFSLVVHTDHSDGCDWCERQCVAYLIGPPPSIWPISFDPIRFTGKQGWVASKQIILTHMPG